MCLEPNKSFNKLQLLLLSGSDPCGKNVKGEEAAQDRGQKKGDLLD